MDGHVAKPKLVPAVPLSARERPTASQFFRASVLLGMIGFGGGLSVLANIHGLVVQRKKWLTEREFANTVTVAQMLPGGAAANALAYVGLRFQGVLGALAGYAGFVLPGFLAVLGLAWLYVHVGTTPSADTVLGGFNAAVVGIIVSITLKMVKTSVTRMWQMALAAGAMLFSLLGNAPPGEVALLSISIGLAVDLGTKRARLASVRRAHKPEQPDPEATLPEDGQTLAQSSLPRPSEPPPASHPSPLTKQGPTELKLAAWTVLFAAALTIHATGLDAELLRLGLTFFRTGLGAYGGGFAIVPHLKQVMARQGWLTDRQFADAVAIGKLTPGPVLLLATFIGYVHHGWAGAVVATIGIFSAPFGLVVLAGTWLDRLRSRRPVRAALRGLTPAVLGLMAAAAITLGDSLSGTGEVGIAAAVALTLGRFNVNPVLMLALGGVARLLLRAAGI